MKSLLVLCEGNICRSPIAAALFKARLPGVSVSSAGIAAVIGAPAHDFSLDLMASRGIDIGSHRAVQVTRQMCKAANLVLVMDQQQRQMIQDTYPEIRGRVFRIGHHANLNVPDPFGHQRIAFEETVRLLDVCVSEWASRIEQLGVVVT